MAGVRIDKWLWAARFFKTRSLAARACDLGRIESNGVTAKPAREVHAGDMLRVRNDAGEFHVEVLALSEIRGPAAVAQALYRETDASREARIKLAEQRKATREFDSIRLPPRQAGPPQPRPPPRQILARGLHRTSQYGMVWGHAHRPRTGSPIRRAFIPASI